MRIFLTLLAALLALGARFSGGDPSPNLDAPSCQDEGCDCDQYTVFRWPPGQPAAPIRGDEAPPP